MTLSQKRLALPGRTASPQRALSRRLISRTDEIVNEDEVADQAAEENPIDADTLDGGDASVNVSDDPEQLREELQRSADRLLRLQAEMQNLRDRTSREITDVRRYASLPLLRDLLPVVDNVTRAIESAENREETSGLLEGFQMVRQQLLTVLQQHHCTEIEAAGQPFDPNQHEAILQQPSDEHPPGMVIMVTQPGYQLHDRVVRASQVIVSTGPVGE